MALGLVATLSVYFYTYYWELSADQISWLLLSALDLSNAAEPWALLHMYTQSVLDKKRGAIWGCSVIALVLAPLAQSSCV